MKKLIISLIGAILFLVGLLSVLDDFVFIVDETNVYLEAIQSNAQNMTAVVDYSFRVLTYLVYGAVISAITIALFSAVVGVIKRF